MTHPNLATLHRSTAERLGPRPALLFKRDGLYRNLSWEAYRRQADGAAAALVGLGIGPGDRVGLLAENRVEWLVADVDILSAGAVGVPLHAPLAPKQVAYQLGHSGARGVIVSDQDQANKVLAVRDELPDLEWIAAFEPIDAGGRLHSIAWDGLIRAGRVAGPGAHAEVRRREAALGPADLATIIYTSGTTGPPKGVMLTHGNLLSNAETTARLSQPTADDVTLSWLPYSHIYARTCDHYVHVATGGVLALAESLDTLMVNLAEVRPSCLASVPRFYEKVWERLATLPAEVRPAAVRKVFGPRARFFSSGGAPLPRHVAEGFAAAGFPLMEGYGLTESSPVISFNVRDAFKVGTVGRAIPDVEVKLAADGEILTRGPHVMKGYWREPEATARAIDPEGWLHTGDIGTLDADGFLAITDRKKDLIITSGGKNVAPSELERLLVSDPYIDQAVVYGDGKPFPTALIVPCLPALEARAAELGCSLSTQGDLIEAEPLRAFLAERIERLMQDVSGPERVKAFLLLGRPFRLENDELTATLKVRRRFIIGEFKDRLDALYAVAPAKSSGRESGE